MKNIYLITTILLLASCSMEQKPAPYEVYGGRYYGKSSSRYANATNRPAYKDEDLLDTSKPDYNNEIDKRNSTQIAARPLGGAPSTTQPSRLQTSAATNSNGITTRQLGEAPAIDGNEQVVKLNSGKTLVHSGASTSTAYDFQRNRQYTAREETVPPVENTENFVNPSEENKQRNADEKLSHLKPLSRPAFTPPKHETAEVGKTKVTAKIKNIETSSGNEPKKAIGSVKAPDDMSDEEDIAETPDDDSDVTDETPVKKIPVEAGRIVDNQAAKTKRETTIAAQKIISKPLAVERTEETVPVVEKPSVVQKAEVEKPVVESKTETEVASLAKPKSQFIKPVDGTIVGEFGGGGDAGGAFNDGINIQAPEGTPVKASSGGTIVYSGNQLQGYGNMVIVKHSNGYLTAYSHLKGLEVKKGEQVGQGDVIGHVGKTGNINSPQLHFGIRKGREPVDPKDYL